MRALKTIFPILDWAPSYSSTDAVNDLMAATIVTIMLVPQSLAHAMLAGLPPHIGLYASILPLVAYAIFGTSRTLAVGPVAVVSLMTAAAASQVAPPGSAEYLEAAITLAFLSGLVLIAMAVLRLGFLANFLSHPVISGFITASGVLIAASQLKHVLGIKAEGDTLLRILPELAEGIGQVNLHTLTVGFLSLGFLFWARRSLKPLLVRAAGIVAGVSLSLLLFLWRTSRPHMAVVGQVPGTEHFRNVERHQVITRPDLLTLRVDESLYFANARVLEDAITDEIAARPGVRNVVLMCSAVRNLEVALSRIRSGRRSSRR